MPEPIRKIPSSGLRVIKGSGGGGGWNLVAQVLAVVGLLGSFALWLITESRSQVEGVRHDVAVLERKVDLNRAEAVQAIQLVREENRETRTDIRALSSELRTGRPTARLGTPVPELAPPPTAGTTP